MIDPLGLKKEPEASDALENLAGEAAGRKPSQDSPTLWFLLMIVDGVFVVVFGGLVAARLFSHWGAPQPASAVVQAKGKKGKAPPPAKPVEPAKPPFEAKAAPVAAVKAPEPPRAPAPPKAPEAVKPPKPSLVQEPPKPHEAPKPQGPAAAKPAAAPKPAAKTATKPAAPAAKVRAIAVDFKVHYPGAKKVQLAGAFLVHGGKKDMAGSEGDWNVTVYLMPGNYRYTFLVDGQKILDPENSKIDRGASVITVLPVP